MGSRIRSVFIVLLFVALVALRVYAANWFYDPLDAFFKGQYQGQALPEIAVEKLIGITAVRYWITAGITLTIIQLWFVNTSKTRLTLWILLAVFLLLLPSFWALITLAQPPLEGLFYIRRFLIQPVLLILLIPAFYYEIKTKDAQA